jgi:predicted ester cyclase
MTAAQQAHAIQRNVDAVRRVLRAGLSCGGGFGEALPSFRGAFADLRFDEEDVVAADDRVVVSCVLRGVHRGEFMGVPPTGHPIAVRQVHFFRVADGAVIEHRIVRDDLSLLLQVGALPW